MRSAPHSRFSVAMRRMSKTTSAEMRGFAGAFRLERHLQNRRNTSRCHPRSPIGNNFQNLAMCRGTGGLRLSPMGSHHST